MAIEFQWNLVKEDNRQVHNMQKFILTEAEYIIGHCT